MAKVYTFKRQNSKNKNIRNMNLPISDSLQIRRLASVFNNTTNSYKYFWFLVILKNINRSNKNPLSIQDLILEMITEIWYPINFFKLSFGKQDQFAKYIEKLQVELDISPEINKKDDLLNALKNHLSNDTVLDTIRIFSRYVPYRFISPWFSEQLRGLPDSRKNQIIQSLSNLTFDTNLNVPIYRLLNESLIEINQNWHEYLQKHYSFLIGYVYWELIKYLQKHNPNVPNLPEKLSLPNSRNLTNAWNFWNVYFEVKGEVNCLYSKNLIRKTQSSLDHFLPWSFVAHDQLWNLIPVSKESNSSKSNNLPSIIYLDNFIKLQFDGLKTFSSCRGIKSTILEDYTMLFKTDITEIISLSPEKFGEIFKKNIKPLTQIATNMGFQTDWIWKKNL